MNSENNNHFLSESQVTRSESHGEEILVVRIPADGSDVTGHLVADGPVLFQFT